MSLQHFLYFHKTCSFISSALLCFFFKHEVLCPHCIYHQTFTIMYINKGRLAKSEILPWFQGKSIQGLSTLSHGRWTKNLNVTSIVVQSRPTNGMTMSCSTFTMFLHRHRYKRITRQADYWIKTVSFLTCIVPWSNIDNVFHQDAVQAKCVWQLTQFHCRIKELVFSDTSLHLTKCLPITQKHGVSISTCTSKIH